MASSFEVIVVDNGSTDGSWDNLVTLSSRIGKMSVYQFRDRKSSYAARNVGASKANGVILAFTDIDCLPTADWICQIERASDEILDGSIVSGAVYLYSKEDRPTRLEAYDMVTHMRQDRYAKDNAGATANLAVSRALFQRIGGFLEVTSGGDLEFCKRACDRGAKLVHKTGIEVRHPARATYKELLEKETRKARGQAEKFLLAEPSRLEVAAFILRGLVGIVFQGHQFRLSAYAKRCGLLSPVLVGLIFLFGWIQRWQIIAYCLNGHVETRLSGVGGQS